MVLASSEPCTGDQSPHPFLRCAFRAIEHRVHDCVRAILSRHLSMGFPFPAPSYAALFWCVLDPVLFSLPKWRCLWDAVRWFSSLFLVSIFGSFSQPWVAGDGYFRRQRSYLHASYDFSHAFVSTLEEGLEHVFVEFSKLDGPFEELQHDFFGHAFEPLDVFDVPRQHLHRHLLECVSFLHLSRHPTPGGPPVPSLPLLSPNVYVGVYPPPPRGQVYAPCNPDPLASTLWWSGAPAPEVPSFPSLAERRGGV